MPKYVVMGCTCRRELSFASLALLSIKGWYVLIHWRIIRVGWDLWDSSVVWNRFFVSLED